MPICVTFPFRVEFDRDAEGSGETVLVSDKAVLLYNQALIHLRVSGEDYFNMCVYQCSNAASPELSSSGDIRTTVQRQRCTQYDSNKFLISSSNGTLLCEQVVNLP